MAAKQSSGESEEVFEGLPTYTIELDAFEGPLDLLLHLVRRHEVDIYNIPIHEITRQYLGVLKEMQQMNLEIAGEFFVMAATLMQIKSSLLLPRDEALPQNEDEEQGEDPRWQLIQQLVEYRKFKDAAGELEQAIERQQDFLPRDYKVRQDLPDKPKLESTDRIALWNTFNNVLRRLSKELGGAGEIQGEQVSVADRMEFILERMKTDRSFLFSSLFDSSHGLYHIIASFLAILELCRMKHIYVVQEENFQDIRVEKRPPIQEDTLEDEEEEDEPQEEASAPSPQEPSESEADTPPTDTSPEGDPPPPANG